MLQRLTGTSPERVILSTISVLVYSTFLLVALFASRLTLALPFGGGVNVGLIVLGLGIIYLRLSFHQVGGDQKAGVFLFDRGLFDIPDDQGLIHAPFFFFKVRRFPAGNIQFELPGEKEELWTEDRQITPEAIAAGMKLPLRITYAEAPENQTDFVIEGITDETGREVIPPKTVVVSSLDPLRRRVTAGLQLQVVWIIESVIQMYRHVGSLENLRKISEDAAVTSIVRILSKYPYAVSLQAQGTLSRIAQYEIGELTRNTVQGARLIRFSTKEFMNSHDLNRTLQAVPEAMAEGNATRTKADAEAYRLKRTGEGLRDGAKASGLSPEVFTASETAPKLTKGAGTVLVGGTGGLADLATAAIGIGRAFQKSGKKESEGEEDSSPTDSRPEKST
jgi:hypothetical protein